MGSLNGQATSDCFNWSLCKYVMSFWERNLIWAKKLFCSSHLCQSWIQSSCFLASRLVIDNKSMGKGQNYENQNIEIQKEHWKCFKASEHRKCLFSSSLLRQSEHQKGHRNWLSMFWFYLWRQKRSERQKLKYQLPMVYYLWIPRPVGPWGVRLGSIRLG